MRLANHQRGHILIMSALLLPMLFAICGFAVDGGNAYYHKSKLQNSVDAAAIAGGYRYGERESRDDTQETVEEYMDKNQGEEAYELEPLAYKNGKQQGTTRITVAAVEQVPVYFIGPILRLLSNGKDTSADQWRIHARATAEVTRVSDDVPGIFKYALIGGRTVRPKGNRGSDASDNALVFHTADVTIAGAVHANGAVYLDDTFKDNDAKKRHYFVTVDKFSSAAAKDADLWTNYRDNYHEHYVGGVDSSWSNGHQTYYDTKYGTTNDKEHVNPGHENDDKIINGAGDRDFTWRYYYRVGLSSGKDVVAEECATDVIDISLSAANPMTSTLYQTIEQYRAMSLAELEARHVYVQTDGNYTRSKSWSDKSYQLNPSSDKSIYPGITCGDFQITDAEGWHVWSKVYKIVIVDGDLQVNIPNNVKPDNENDHVLFVSLHGNISVQSGSPIYGYFYAPQGTVLVDGSRAATIYGSIGAQCVYFTTGGQHVDARNSTFGQGQPVSPGSKNTGNVTVRLVDDEEDA